MKVLVLRFCDYCKRSMRPTRVARYCGDPRCRIEHEKRRIQKSSEYGKKT